MVSASVGQCCRYYIFPSVHATFIVSFSLVSEEEETPMGIEKTETKWPEVGHRESETINSIAAPLSTQCELRRGVTIFSERIVIRIVSKTFFNK